MTGLLERLGVQLRLDALGVGVLIGLLAGLWCGSIPLGVIVGLGIFVLFGQILAARRNTRLAEERLEVRRLLERVTPLARTGMPLETAFINASKDVSFAGCQALAFALRAGMAGRLDSRAGQALERWPYCDLVYQLILIHRENGGDPSRFLEAYRGALGLVDDLAKKKQIALVQIRWQANIITIFFFLVVAFSFSQAGVYLAALVQTDYGRSLTIVSASLVVWGRVVLNGLARTME
ncbi:hypothetical protein [Caulobacter henricii]|uniref:Type II secretion system protein GspF domain-containing protein n=1 Tax=Caulobacter henricii TaxID=69395 RepID=A0A0P0NY84_9CAUL|nr:hypothetical protein [Caulobacter henricii]ALL13087.1 hypothetical protein AQ619_06830 [Caulobacter henricii]